MPKTRRRRATPVPEIPVPEITENQVPSPEATAARSGPLVLSDVYLLTAESQGEVAVPGLTVQLDGAGLTVRKPDGAVGAVLAWTEVSAVVTSGRMRTPAGNQGVVVEAVTPSRTHRFVVPSDNPEGLEYEIGQLAGAVAVGSGSSPGVQKRSRVLLGALLVIIVAGIALAVLVATGTVTF